MIEVKVEGARGREEKDLVAVIALGGGGSGGHKQEEQPHGGDWPQGGGHEAPPSISCARRDKAGDTRLQAFGISVNSNFNAGR